MKKKILSLLLVISLMVAFTTSIYASSSHFSKTIDFDLNQGEHFAFYFTSEDLKGNDDLILNFNIFDSSKDPSLLYVLVDITDPVNFKYIGTGSATIKGTKTIIDNDAFKDYTPSDNAIFQLGVVNNSPNNAEGNVTIQVY